MNTIKIRAIDFETTGFPPCGIIEIGWTDIDIDISPIDCTTTFMIGETHNIRTLPDLEKFPMSVEAMAVHHIIPEDLVGCPPPETILNERFLEEPDYFCAHNFRFETQLVKPKKPWICTMRSAIVVWPDAPSHSNQGLRYYRGYDSKKEFRRERAMPPHAGGPDTYTTAHIFVDILTNCGRKLEELVEWTNQPMILPKITFGKHRGSKWSDVPTDYLLWAKRQDFDEDVKATIQYHLKNRNY